MGKDEPVSSTDTSTNSSEQKSLEKILAEKKTEEPAKRPEPDRKIIKFTSPENASNQNKTGIDPKKKTSETPKADEGKPGKVPDVNKIIGDKTPGASADQAREELEQRRTILQNLKDFDFQIKKNQEDIGALSDKVESLSKDLDDLVSLYEIVSEQMNPFVGLSKVTKKRLDALENITKELDTIKGKMGDIESSLEKGTLITEAAKKNGLLTAPENTTVANTALPEIKTTSTTTPIERPASPVETSFHQSFDAPFSEKDLDEILSKSLENLVVDQNIDSMINEFFLSLK